MWTSDDHNRRVAQMKVLIDILTPKQGMLFSRLSERLRKEGHQTFETTRQYREAIQLLNMKGIKARVVGQHGGETLEGKLKASVERTLELTRITEEIHPDIAVSFSSPELARLAFGLKLPHIILNDSPHAEAVARLTIPLATRLLTPEMIPKSSWIKFGISANKITQYKALDAWAWLKDLKPNRRILSQLNIDTSMPIIVFRTEESQASYLLGKTSRAPVVVPLIEKLLRSKADFHAVAIPRYDAQIAFLKEKFRKRVVVTESIIDTPSLLYYASAFVGAGGTMTQEAALLGVPTFSCYPGKPYIIENHLVRRGLIVRESDMNRIMNLILKILADPERTRQRQLKEAKKLTDTFEDPLDVAVRAIQEAA